MNPKVPLVFAAAALLLAIPAAAAPNNKKSNGDGGGNTNHTNHTNHTNNSSSSSSITLPDPLIPVGVLSATPEVVQTGTYPTLKWAIAYPTTVSDLVNLIPPAQLVVAKNNTWVDIRVVGVGVTSSTPGVSTNNPAEFRISEGGGNYTQLFYGNNEVVDPGHSVFSKKVGNNTTLNFGGRFAIDNSSWSSFMTGVNPNVQMVALKNGDPVPTSYNLAQSGNMASYLQPYVNSNNTVSIGSNSLLIMCEYGGTDHTHSTYDFQDFVALVNFSGKNNNGHGNNIDGVDSSNPGQGKGGPTGIKNAGEDPSGTFDDEGHSQHQQ